MTFGMYLVCFQASMFSRYSILFSVIKQYYCLKTEAFFFLGGGGGVGGGGRGCGNKQICVGFKLNQ